MKSLAILPIMAGILSAETPPGIRAMVKQSLHGINREDNRKGDFLYRVFSEKREFDAAGKETSKESKVVVREMRDGFAIGRVVERNGKPIDEAEKARQEASLQRSIAEAKAAKAKPPAPKPARRKQSNEEAWIQEFPEALDYKQAGEEAIRGRPATILEFEPRPGYKPSNMRARIFEKMRGKLWIDKEESELVKVEAEMFDTVSMGFGLFAKIAKGTQFGLERRKVAEGAWLEETTRFRFDARFLVKTLRMEQIERYSDYQLRPDRQKPVTARGAR